ncbi:type VI secretion system accessory protein TagJ [Aquisphaera insulae]|uniref:type VI secretion system accessory protein TagJ n=1 Tax=Aquisphaera insulae TaxID=2712864 RepID=UPI0013EC4785|nr:type VI secretion system accessory protein TagJ [Aquisphaera insulae]
MNAGELYRAGKLSEAIEAQVADVKAHPLDQSKRLFLFELLLFSGELDRARRQAESLHFADPDLERAAANYRRLVDSEQARRDVFEKGTSPAFFGPPSDHLKLRLEAVGCLRGGKIREAGELLARADEATPPVSGSLNDQPFQVLRDADDLFGGILEVMAQGRYFWAGLEQVRVAAMNPPSFPRDLLYIPARLELESESGEVFLPALYPGSASHADDQVRLGRLTDWKTLEGDVTLGVGLHTYLRDDDATTLLDWREFRAGEP